MTDPRWMIEERTKPEVPWKMVCKVCNGEKSVMVPIRAAKVLMVAGVQKEWVCGECKKEV